MKILVLNAGSSSHKSCLYDVVGDALPESAPAPLWEAEIEGVHTPNVCLHVKTGHGNSRDGAVSATSPAKLIAHMLETLISGPNQVIERIEAIDIVGHRVVHGGRDYRNATLIDDEVKAAIARLSSLAPEHNPANLQGIEIVEKLLPVVPQIAVFDTAFHSNLPDAAAIYPGPYEWVAQDIRRYGFHGISHQYCAGRAAEILDKDLTSLRLITCHLGNGCSLAAIQDGRSIDTTMGFTPLEGLMMGTRSGSVDPGILLYLMREKGYSAAQLDHILNEESGLKGISGLSGDMREIAEAIAQGDERAQLAFDMYVHRVRFHVGAMLAALGGLDVLVFTAGVGEHSPALRGAVCDAFKFLGLELDGRKNEGKPIDEDIATRESQVRVLVIQAQEDWAIAGECWKFSHQMSKF